MSSLTIVVLAQPSDWEVVSAPNTHAVRFAELKKSFAHPIPAPTGFNGPFLVRGEPHINLIVSKIPSIENEMACVDRWGRASPREK